MLRPSQWFGALSLALITVYPSDLHAAAFPDAADGTFEYVAVRSGAWHDANTWNVTGIPGAGDDVLVPATCDGSPCQVTVERQEPDAIRYLKVEGEFQLDIYTDTRVQVETIYIAPGATFRIGDTGPGHVQSGFTAEVVFTGSGPIDTIWDPKQVSRGLVSDGVIRFYGEPKTHMAAKSSDALAGDTSIVLNALPTDWAVDDEVVLTGSYFDRYTTPTSSQDEVRVISSFTAGGVSFSPGLAHDHRRAVADMNLHVANLTRNLVLRSASTSPVQDRGHVMFRNGDVIIHNAAFVGLGRADKSIPLDDLVVTLKPDSTNPTSYEVTEPTTTPSNPRGRYSLHFHVNGVSDPAGPPPSTVHGSVVRDAVGWGFVNHSSHVDFRHNVAYDFVGAGFVAEAGNELGNFVDNIAIRGTGDGDFDPIHRFVFKNLDRPQPLSDFGFRGDGFWFQGPAITVRDNVASGCDSAGMVWFTTGAPIHNDFFIDTDGYQKNKYSHFPREWIDPVYGAGMAASIDPRHWLRPGESGNSRTVIVDLPILEMDGFEAYGNYVGFRLRFNNQASNSWYRDLAYDYGLMIQDTGTVIRAPQAIQNLKLWNNQQAFRMRYAGPTQWSNVTALNRLAYDSADYPDAGHEGAEFLTALVEHEFLDLLTIEGYPVAGHTGGASNVAFNGQSYQGYANFDSWDDELNCATPTGLGASDVQPTSLTLSWSSSSPRHSMRYRKPGEQLWTYVGPVSGSSTTVGDLAAGTSYEFQVVSGCTGPNTFDSLSAWSEEGTFQTTAPPLIAHYPLDGDADDALGTNDGVLQNFPANPFVDDNPIGSGALRFDGIDDHVAIQNLYYQSSDLEAVSVSAWVRTTNGSRQMIVSFDRSEYWRLDISGTGVGFGQIGWHVRMPGSTVDFSSVATVDDGEWHHVAAVFDGAAEAMRLYIDGQLDNSVTGLSSTFGSGATRYGFLGVGSEATVAGGATNGNNYFQGDLDDVWIFDRALNDAEVMELYELGNSP